MKKQKKLLSRRLDSKKFFIAMIALAGIFLLGYFFLAGDSIPQPGIDQESSIPPDKDKSTETKPNDTNNQPPTNNEVKPSVPELQKSSGNVGSVPAGALIEFICRTDAVVDCAIILTHQSGTVIALDKKQTENDRQGHYAAIWTWDAKPGTWRVVARASNAAGETDSEVQNLEVQ